MDRARMFARGVSLCSLSIIFASLLAGCTHTKSLFSTGPSKIQADYIEPTTSMDFVIVKGGQFMMGDNIGDVSKRELPVHEVTVKDFAVGVYEVTFAQYDKFCEATGHEKPSDEGWGRGNRPVINVSWYDAKAFAEWLTEHSDQTFSLPSEAQWEYFARAGTTTRYWTGDKFPQNAANCKNCGSQWDDAQTAPVGSFNPTPWGVYDTAGNVREWCQDDLHDNYEGAPVDGSAWLSGARKAIHRGGSWRSPAVDLSTSVRSYSRKKRRHKDLGFRLVTTPPSPTVK